MQIREACSAILDARGDRVIVSTMTAMFTFDALRFQSPRISSVPLMGGAASIGLGLSLARPDVGVIVVDGDASLLMQLGGLVTVAENKPHRLTHFVVANRAQFHGMSNLPIPGGDNVDLCAMACAAGYLSAHTFSDVALLQQALPELLDAPGPNFVVLDITPEPPALGAERPQKEVPDRQFQRMGAEATALAAWYEEREETQQ
ncbi:hypothetical protein LMG23992_01399 [Cupriavidus laharis]|uniref:Thiamine pyrophosphate enzyme TPP-binding domain-containing protein n=1 Tax=Cupriavidus laharis TaxID=151654 RepID=A0ABM8WPA9_9BURK|nr:thiamine pyrophosphate-dependent enzyme [Cupriavidus laharis]CAG9169122.1 hypothetical protein LMG23992_01399 [Cupriavidus laharis]